MPKIAIIGGTGVYDPTVLSGIREETVKTKYGQVTVKTGTYANKEVAFLARHGENHSVPPHKVNYRANIMALKELGVEKIIATAATGSLNLEMRPGDFVLADQFIDFTKGRPQTFYEDSEQGVVHIDMTHPYCVEVRNVLSKAGQVLDIKIYHKGTYVCTEGPRFETPAEIKMYSQLGGDLVGMTSVPEVVLAKEAEMCYATVAAVTNFAAGISPTPLTHAEVLEAMKNNNENLKKLIMQAVAIMPEKRGCACKSALGELGSLGQKKGD